MTSSGPSAHVSQRTFITACTGAEDCPSRHHIHGCFADLDFRRCDDPVEHALGHPSSHVRAWAEHTKGHARNDIKETDRV